MAVQSTLVAESRLPPELLSMIFAQIYYEGVLAQETLTLMTDKYLRTSAVEVNDGESETEWVAGSDREVDEGTNNVAVAMERVRANIGQARRDLASCALVSRTFNVAVTPWLFRDFKFTFSLVPTMLEALAHEEPGRWACPGYIKYKEDFERQYEVLDYPGAGQETACRADTKIPGGRPMWTRNILNLLNFLKSHDVARTQIRSLTLAGHWSPYIFETEMERVDARDLLELLHMLPRLHHLTLHNVPVKIQEVPPLTVCGPLENLSITFSNNYYTQRDYLRLMHCFGEVEILKLSLPGLFTDLDGDGGLPGYEEIVPPIRARSFIFNLKGMFRVPVDLMDNLFKHSEVKRVVTTLQLERWSQVSQRENAKVLLDTFKPTLTRIVLGMDGRWSAGHVDFSGFPALETLEFRYKLLFQFPEMCRRKLLDAATCLSTKFRAGPALRTLILCFTPTQDPARPRVRHQLGRRVLAGVLRRLASAHRFVIDVRVVLSPEAGASEEKQAARLLRRILPDAWQDLSPWIKASILKGDEVRPFVAPKAGVV